MGFKDQVASDLLGVFLRTDEFGETRTIDGSPVASVLDRDARIEHGADGVFVLDSMLFVREVDLDARPAVDQRLTIDGEYAHVVRVVEENGMLAIGLRWYDS